MEDAIVPENRMIDNHDTLIHGADHNETPVPQSLPLLMSDLQKQLQMYADRTEDVDREYALAKQAREQAEGDALVIRSAFAEAAQQLENASKLVSKAKSLHNTLKGTMDQFIDAQKATCASAVSNFQATIDSEMQHVNRMAALRAEVEQKQAVIAEKSSHIENARIHADGVSASIDRLHDDAEEVLANAQAELQASKAAAKTISDISARASEVKTKCDAEVDELSRLREQAEESTAISEKLAKIAETTEERVQQYETTLKKLTEEAAKRLKTIESLLPGAASAGLASAFSKRRSYFESPRKIWQTIFVASVLALLGLALLELHVFSQAETTLTWDMLSVSLLRRLPFALPLIWLAFHASHSAALAQRVEEDYAFKETVSSSFEGFRREMKELEGHTDAHSPLSQLCSSVLAIVTNPPGRIYEKHRLNTTPLSAITDSAGPLASAASKAITSRD